MIKAIRRFSLCWIGIIVLLSLLLINEASAAPFDSLSIKDQTKAILYAQNMKQCIIDLGVKNEVDTNDADNKYGWMVNFENEIQQPVTHLINNDKGTMSCGDLFGSNTIGESGWKFFGLNNLDTRTLLEDVFGYTQSSQGRTNKYEISITGTESAPIYYWQNGYKPNDGGITFEITLPYPIDVVEDSGSFQYLDSLHQIPGYEGVDNLSELYMENNLENSALRQRVAAYLYGVLDGTIGAKLTTNDGIDVITGSIADYGSISTEDYARNVSVVPLEVEVKPGIYSVDSKNMAWAKFISYLNNNYFGRDVFGPETFSVDRSLVQAYYLYMYELSSPNVCNAKFVEIEEPETRVKYRSLNEFFTKVKIVNNNSEAVEVYADWSSGLGEFVNNAKISSNIPTGSLSTANGVSRDAYSEDCKAIADRLSNITNSLNAEQLRVVGNVVGEIEASIADDATNGNETSDADQPTCYKGAGGLAWVLCPIITAASGLGEAAWGVIEGLLQVPAQAIFREGGGVEQGWGIVRNIANVVFIILFLFVIFSQLTGVGIDNYGIKKILPKLIIVVVLVNLSYLLCELAVDVSNTLGIGLNNLFNGIGSNLENLNVTGASGFNIASGFLFTGALSLGGIALFGVLSGGLTLGLAGAAIGMAAFGIIITILCAVLTLYIILVLREAGIVLAIVIAPIAIVCYLLPNTEKMYKKWLGLMRSLLLIYPICGAIVGIGKLSGLILASVGSSSMLLAGMVVQVLPYFFIPMLLKNSTAMMGNIGAKISSYGKSFGRKGSSTMQNAVRGSNKFKEFSQIEKDKGAFNRAVKIRNKLSGKKNLSERDLIRLDMANRTILGRKESIAKAKNMANQGFRAAEIAQEKRATAEAIDNAMMLVKNETNDGVNEDKLVEIFDKAMSNGDIVTARAALRVAGRRKDTASRFMKNTILSGKKYKSGVLSGVVKEIAEGETSGNYISGAPLGFEYASQLNKNGADAVGSYSDWKSNKKNIHDAFNNYIPTSDHLMGVQDSNLTEIADMIDDGAVDTYDADRVSYLAKEAIRVNKENGVRLDNTKAFNLYRIAYGDEKFLDEMRKNEVAINDASLKAFKERKRIKLSTQERPSGAAREGEPFVIRQDVEQNVHETGAGADSASE